MKALIDNGIWSHAEFLNGARLEKTITWGGKPHSSEIIGYVRKAPSENPTLQAQYDALFTIGRLIREGRIEAFDYFELMIERIRARGRIQECNALAKCVTHKCDSPLDRSKFGQTIYSDEFIAKGDKSHQDSAFTQMSFVRKLCTFGDREIQGLKKRISYFKFSDFEFESLADLPRFQASCREPMTERDYPDLYHVWTAERNALDCFLTIDLKFIRKVQEMSSRKRGKREFKVDVLSPIECLQKLGIKVIDRVPVEHDRFYYLHEVSSMQNRVGGGI